MEFRKSPFRSPSLATSFLRSVKVFVDGSFGELTPDSLEEDSRDFFLEFFEEWEWILSSLYAENRLRGGWGWREAKSKKLRWRNPMYNWVVLTQRILNVLSSFSLDESPFLYGPNFLFLPQFYERSRSYQKQILINHELTIENKQIRSSNEETSRIVSSNSYFCTRQQVRPDITT